HLGIRGKQRGVRGICSPHQRGCAALVLCINVSASLQERSDHFGVRVIRGGPHQRGCAALVLCFYVSASLQERSDHLGVQVIRSRVHQRGSAILVSSLD